MFATAALVAPLVLLALLEAGLRLFGVGQSYPLFIPVPDSPGFLQANPQVIRRFVIDEAKAPDLWIRPGHFRDGKAPGSFRIFVQGESTAEGYPYGYVASPAGLLQQRLQRTFPERRIEAITTAMCAVSSYPLLDFTDEIIEQDPDAVVIYAGHNEYVGVLGVGSGFSVSMHRAAVLSFLWLRDLRIFQLLQGAFSSGRPERAERSNRTLMATIVREKEIPLGSALYDRGLRQYEANLSEILGRYRSAGVPVFIGTVVCNERDQAPFIGGHGAGADVDAWEKHVRTGRAALEAGDASTALREFEKAVEFDDVHAAGHFERGRALDRLGRYAEARAAYLAAKDRDQLRFRAPEAINGIVREVAAEYGAHVVEVQEAFVESARNGIVGSDLMLEHVHPNLRGYFLMADAFYDAIREEGMIGPWENPVSREQAWDEVPVTEVDRLYGEYRISYLMSDWPFKERKVAFRPEPAKNRVESIAQGYYRGRYEWPDAMRQLLAHCRSVGDDVEAAKSAMLLADAFPDESERQMVAADSLMRVRNPLSNVYLERAQENASPRDKERLLALRRRAVAGN